MELHLLYILGAQLWTLVSAILFPILAIIATFVCLRRAKLSHKLIGFFTLIPIYVAVTVMICGDTGGLISDLLPPLGIYPVVGFLASIALGILCLNFIAIICGTGALKRKGAIINSVATLISFAANVYFTYSAWVFAQGIYKAEEFRKDSAIISIRDAIPSLESLSFLPDSFLDSGIEILATAILIIYLVIYFLSLTAIKTPEEIRRDNVARLHRQSHAKRSSGRGKADNDEDDSVCKCCEYCEYAEQMKSEHMKMLCRYKGIVASSHICGKYVYDPLKRKTFRPRISPLSQSDGDTDDI